ncbi:predicted protein [Naegleria gruberi]|uniref:Predicted protein n=1 Tax=Naegleria gruberi TaxID=5762 RepID=D2W3F5_NAEGR|nr:uncharacterized protein NAEGRDRAFT_82227 [Naegleria gruberi]EFC36377.1 predicted protein [Naegleria gruberi]|eukprot:XP_002669121.1 predicted protein [Naegleria gruberi strain NEG-M]
MTGGGCVIWDLEGICNSASAGFISSLVVGVEISFQQKIGIGSLSTMTGLADYYKTLLGIDLNQFVGYEIVEIDDSPATSYMIDWSDKNCGGYKDLGARFNMGLGLFVSRAANRVAVPDNSTIKYKLEKDGDVKVLEIPFVGTSSVKYLNDSKFYESCLRVDSAADVLKSQGIPTRKTHLYNVDPHFEKRELPLKSTVQGTFSVNNILNGDMIKYYELTSNQDSSILIGVIVIEIFSPKSIQQFSRDFQTSLYLAKLHKAKKIILDVTNNGGGYICLGYAFSRYFFPKQFSNQYESLFARTDMIASELGKELAQKGSESPQLDTIWMPHFWRDDSGKVYNDDSWFTNQHTFSRGGVDHAYTSIIKDNGCSEMFDDFIFTGDDLLDYSSDDLIILSNGRCASTCAMFTFQLQQFKKAKTVVVGGVHNTQQQIGQLPGGQVCEQPNLVLNIEEYNMTQSEHAPKLLPTTSRLRFAIREAYAWADSQLNSLEFSFLPSDFRLDYSKESAMDPTKVWIDTLQFFDKCAPWQTQTCQITNGIGMKSCNSGTYSSECKLISCNDGFGIANGNDFCTPCPLGTFTKGTVCEQCTNKPVNSHYLNNTQQICEYQCDLGFEIDNTGTKCVESEYESVQKPILSFLVALCVIAIIVAFLSIVANSVLGFKLYQTRKENQQETMQLM